METATNNAEVIVSPPGGLSLRRNFVWTLAGNAFYGACQWGMLVALAKLGSPVMVGQFALGLAIGAPVILLSNLQLRAVLATDVRDQYDFRHYLELRLVATLLALLTIAAIAVAGGYRWETALVVILVGVAKSVESVSDIFYGLFQKFERLDRISIAMMLRGLGSLAGFACVLWLTGRLIWAVVVLAGWWSVVLLTYEYQTSIALLRGHPKVVAESGRAWEWPKLRRLARLSLPLGVVMVLVSLNSNIPRYFIEHYHGEAALGYFVALAYVMVAGYTVMGALGQSASARLARYEVTAPAAFRRLLAKMLLLALGIGGGGILIANLWGPAVLTLLYRHDYAEYAGVFGWVMIAAAISYVGSMLGYAMTSARIFRAQIPIFAISLLATTLTCALYVKSQGLVAAAHALVVGASIAAIGAGAILLGRSRGQGPLAEPGKP